MLKILCDLLSNNNIVMREIEQGNYWEETDDTIVLDDFYYIQVGTNYLILWQQVPNMLSSRAIYDVKLDKIDNTKKVKQFINKVKTIYKSSADDLYDYSAE